MLRNKWLGHLMIIFTQVVLGVNIPITRDLLLNYLSPMGYIGVRAVGAALFFWTIQFFAKRERIDKRDFWLILLGGFLGFVFSQYLTSLSLQYTTPVYFSLILALSPVVVLLLQAIFFGEKITRKKLFGILLGILGAAILAVRAAFETGSAGDQQPTRHRVCHCFNRGICGLCRHLWRHQQKIPSDHTNEVDFHHELRFCVPRLGFKRSMAA